MQPTAEQLLLATGLVAVPDRDHVTAAGVLVDDLKRQLTEALDLEEPGRFYVVNTPKTYFDRLTREPDYEAAYAFLEARLDPDTALAYQVAHQNARQVLLERHPSTVIESIMGPVLLDNDPMAEEQYALEVGAVEQLRIVKDLAAGALLAETVDVFRRCFPETYQALVDHLDDVLAKKGASKGWAPAPFLEDGLKVFLGLPYTSRIVFTGPITKPTPAQPKAKPASKPSKSTFRAANLQTPAQRAAAGPPSK